MDQSRIRNFCIIAHIDHGKSTLADRLLELTGTVEKRKMREQLLDQMDLERERGITIKLAPVRLNLALGSRSYVLNLIDTPGHVDFTYEVSRSLAAVEGALLLVDATQGVQAQTIGNLNLARELGLTIIPVINKIDLPNANLKMCQAELSKLLAIDPSEIILASGKTGQGVPEILSAIVKEIPSPRGRSEAPLRALIFDSVYDDYQGVVAYVRVVDGLVRPNQTISFLGAGQEGAALAVGVFRPERTKTEQLAAGEIGYLVTGLKEISGVRVGDTVTEISTLSPAEKISPLPGYKELQPMVYAGVYPQEGVTLEKLREALFKLKLNDAALTFEPERSTALGFGFRLGLLGLLHLEIVRERLRREQGIDLLVTLPSVAYRVKQRDGVSKIIKSALELPDPSQLDHLEEPFVRVEIITPERYLGGVMRLAQEKRGHYLTTDYLEDRVLLSYEMSLASIIVDFYDKLKSVSAGYASFHYEFLGWRPADVVRLDLAVAEEMIEAFSLLVNREEASRVGRRIVEKLKETLPRQQFELKIQAKIGGKIIAAERLSPLRKDVLAKLYGGDVTRKDKLLKKQAAGKRRLGKLGRGRVKIPPEAYLAILKSR